METELSQEAILELAEKYQRMKQQQKEWREKNKERIKEYHKKHYTPVSEMEGHVKASYEERKEMQKEERKNNPAKYLLKLAVQRAKKNNLELDITEEDIIVPEYCPVLGIKLCFTNNVVKDDSPSIDRLDPDKGYIKGNILVMSFLANSMKRTANEEYLISFADWVYSRFKPSVDPDV